MSSDRCIKPLDVKRLLRTNVFKKIVAEFKAGLSVRVLSYRYGLNADGVERLLRSQLR